MSVQIALVVLLPSLLIGLSFGQGGQASASELRIASEKRLSSRGSTRGTGYSMSNKIVTFGDKTHVSWLDTKSATMIRTFDHSTGEWLPVAHVGSGKDNHGGPALCVDSKGYLHIVFGSHNGPFQYCRSERPNDASSWIKMGEFGDGGTYPSLVCGPDDTLYIAYRGGPVPKKLLLQRRPLGGEWSAPTVVMETGAKRGYTNLGNSLCIAADATLHVAFHAYGHPGPSRRIGHLQSKDGGTSWTLADGAPVRLPYGPDQPGWIAQDLEGNLSIANVAVAHDGTPYVASTSKVPPPFSGRLWRFADGKWENIELTPILRARGAGPSVSAGALCFDEKGGLYVSVQTGKQGEWGEDSEIFLLYSRDGARTFEVVPVTGINPGIPNWLPSIERHTGHNRIDVPHLLYTHGVPGKGCTPPDLTEIRLVTFAHKSSQDAERPEHHPRD